MKGSFTDLPIMKDTQEGRVRKAEWGSLTVVLGEVHVELDRTSMFKGLPDDRCQCPHWGYLIQGSITYKFADHDETYNAGDVFYAPPGHTIIYGKGAVYIEFSPTDELKQTLQVIARNISTSRKGN